MMPRRRQPQKLPKIGHIVLQNHHNNIRINVAIIATKFQEPLWLLDQYALLLWLRLVCFGSSLCTFSLVLCHSAVSLASSSATSIIFRWQVLLLRRIDVFDLVQQLFFLAVVFFVSTFLAHSVL